jgi:hypothetical protein
MTSEQLRRLIAAPEIIVLDLVHASLRALHLALLAEHPLIDDELAAVDDPPVRRHARILVRNADRLARALRAYKRCVDNVLKPTEPPAPSF